MIDEAEFRAEIRRAYECGVQEARASFAADLRALADDMVHQVFELREEVAACIENAAIGVARRARQHVAVGGV
jgi:hypothetical protein